jgi:LacI family transcriptional regulator
MVKKAGHSCSVYKVKPKVWGAADWNLSIRALADWLASLPKPVALFSWGIGREVIYACRSANLKIPNEVSLLLLGYDDIFCEIGHLTLSGIRHAWTTVGYEAAKCLDQMMSGKKLKTYSRFFPPTGVETLRSTDAMALSDPALIAALNFIHSRAHEGVQVDELARHAGVSRRVLERRFLVKLDCSPAEYIRNVRFERAKKLLRETSMSIPEVAEASGFSTAEYLANSFQKQLGISPLKYRRQGAFVMPDPEVKRAAKA